MVAPEEQLHALLSQLQASGLSPMELEVRGIFHAAHHHEVLGSCGTHAMLQLPDASSLSIPAWTDTSTKSMSHRPLHRTPHDSL